MGPNSLNNQFFITAYFIVSGNRLHLIQYSDPLGQQIQTTIPRGIELSLPLSEIESVLHSGPVRLDLREASSLPPPLTAYPRQLGCKTAAYVPILQKGQLRGLVLIGGRDGQQLTGEVVEAFAGTIKLTTNALDVPDDTSGAITERQSAEIKALNTLASNTTNVDDLRTFYKLIHDQIRSVIGQYGFVIALYDQRTNSISIPYLYEDNTSSSIDSFPLGEGLTSILIRTREPLMLVEDTEKRAVAMGAKVAGRAAKSWLGVPMIVRGEAI